ncbi:hypothetical protein LPJ61_003675 [Coemansia biformis]|uniref:RING-type domain-containing protein n=1 Tax=Coemansia biformis TaxID=1286918 RepID=A0A9W7YBQ3_9FUNG|nr:hypothetical protein LPJ61_003675 [Coemansia biformis]
MEPTVAASPAPTSTTDHAATTNYETPAAHWRTPGKAQTTITAVVFAVWALFAAALAVVIIRKRRAARRSGDAGARAEESTTDGAASVGRRSATRISKITLTAPQLALLPAMAFSDYAGSDLGADGEKTEVAIDIPVCAICLDNFEQTSMVRALACSHVFHADCVDRWLLKRSCRCPLCNSDTRGLPIQPRKPSSLKLAD